MPDCFRTALTFQRDNMGFKAPLLACCTEHSCSARYEQQVRDVLCALSRLVVRPGLWLILREGEPD